MEQKRKLTPKKPIDLTALPPCLSSLKQHIKRVNYQTAIWKGANVPLLEIPSVEEHGWKLGDGGIEPVWCEGPVMPRELSDLLDRDMGSDSEEEYMSSISSSNDDSDSD